MISCRLNLRSCFFQRHLNQQLPGSYINKHLSFMSDFSLFEKTRYQWYNGISFSSCCWMFQDHGFSPECVCVWLFSHISANPLPQVLQLLAFVGFHVSVQDSSSPESFPTCCACKRLLVRVDCHMRRQWWLVTESLPTCLANVRLLACMNSYVNFQVAAAYKIFATRVASVRFLSGVAPHVNCEPITVSEVFPTNTTCVQLLACVDFYMRFQRRWIIKTFPAGGARMTLHTRVNHPVSPQCPLTFKFFSTIVTFQGKRTHGRITVDLRHVSHVYIITLFKARSLLLYDRLLFLLTDAEFLLFLFNLWRFILFHTGALPV